MIGNLAFSAPWVLYGLIVLPLLWVVLRAVPPAPVRRYFPAVVLLLGLRDDESQADRTPWWLLVLRTLMIAAVIVGMAGPVLNPQAERAGSGPVLILLDDTWAAAPDWSARMTRLENLLAEAGRAGRSVFVMPLNAPEPPAFTAANIWAEQIDGFDPRPYAPDPELLSDWLLGLEGSFDTWWISDGLADDTRADVVARLQSFGDITVFETGRPVFAMRPPVFDGASVALSATRTGDTTAREIAIQALGPDPNGTERILARGTAMFEEGSDSAELSLTLPTELLARVNRFAIEGHRSAGAVALADDSLRRREVAIISDRGADEGLQLLSPTYYLEKALEPSATLITGALEDMLPANPDVIVFADVATLSDSQATDVLEWVEAGGTLLRFAGPRVAASDLSRETEDPLMPVRLRQGGRSIGGAMSWGDPKSLRPFGEDSPFYGLPLRDDVTVSTQVLAQPDPNLSDRVIAALSDGTPLVTRKGIGQGRVVFFHISANAEWSSLALSGLFVDMLERLSISSRINDYSADDLAGTTWSADLVLNGYGELGEAQSISGIAGEDLTTGRLGPSFPPGVYSSATRDERIAVNVLNADSALMAAQWPTSVPVEITNGLRELGLKGYLIALAILLYCVDVVATLALSGVLIRRSGAVLGVLLAVWGAEAQAQSTVSTDQDAFAILASDSVTLAHVITGNSTVDSTALAGLRGLGMTLFRRSSVEPGPPVSVDLERDELVFFPILYWPITPDQPIPSDEAYDRLNRYLQTGGLILFDTRDAGLSGTGTTPEGRHLQTLAAPLNIPALERVPSDHVLTRTFYLLQDFPGRYTSRDVWIEASVETSEQIEGVPFRNLNDGVSPVVIGGNDWAAAWAVDDYGDSLLPVGRGFAGERQREIALRFGVNLVMYVLTGNYKSDQVHVPDLLERLGE